MKLRLMNFATKILAIGIMLVPFLVLAAGCQNNEAPATDSEEPAISELNIDLLGTQHTVFLDGEGRLKDKAILESHDHAVILSINSGTTLLDKDGKPLSFLQVKIDLNPPDPPAGAQIIGTVCDLIPDRASSSPPLMLTLPYRPEDLPEDVQEKDLYIAPYDEETGWGKSFYKKIDTESHKVTAQVSTLSKYAILASKELPPPPSLTMTSLEEALSNGRPTIAEFGSSKCVPCKMMKPVLENLAIIFEEELNVVVIEIYESMGLAREYKIMAIPTQIIFDENGQEITRHIGYWPMEEILAELEQTGVK